MTPALPQRIDEMGLVPRDTLEANYCSAVKQLQFNFASDLSQIIPACSSITNELSTRVCKSNQGTLLYQPTLAAIKALDESENPSEEDYEFRYDPQLDWRSTLAKQLALQYFIKKRQSDQKYWEDLFSSSPLLRPAMGHLFEFSFHKASCDPDFYLSSAPAPFDVHLPIPQERQKRLSGASSVGFNLHGAVDVTQEATYLLSDGRTFPIVDAILMKPVHRFLIQVTAADQHSLNALRLAQVIDRLMTLLPESPTPRHTYVLVGRVDELQYLQDPESARTDAAAIVHAMLTTMRKNWRRVIARQEPDSIDSIKSQWRSLSQNASLRSRVANLSFAGFILVNENFIRSELTPAP